ncbi:helix-turn-helix domain-containing protein [Streptacidiphilus sp. EB129]|uniref:helix-turn-helix transcriptional regulator n=1 Tax=Streptacidiphilus sp. EB129 TaxID=3156262 RepID=UPI0035120227
MTLMFDPFETSVTEAAGHLAEVTGLLTELSEQAERWQADLTRAQSRMKSLELRNPDVLTIGQTASFIADLLARGAERISYVRPTDALLLDSPESREAVWAGSGVSAQELVSRPTMAPRMAPEQSRIHLRVTWTELQEIAIIDDAVALIPSQGADHSVEIAVVQQPLVVRQLAQFFDAAWMQATSWQDQVPLRGGAEAELRHRIIGLLAEGAKDETVARRLGISLRTCRRHVAEILSQLGSTSRFQAGVRAALLGTVPAQPTVNPGRPSGDSADNARSLPRPGRNG